MLFSFACFSRLHEKKWYTYLLLFLPLIDVIMIAAYYIDICILNMQLKLTPIPYAYTIWL